MRPEVRLDVRATGRLREPAMTGQGPLGILARVQRPHECGGVRSHAIDGVAARRQGGTGLELSVSPSGCVAAKGTGEQARRLRPGKLSDGHNPAFPGCVKPGRTVFEGSS